MEQKLYRRKPGYVLVRGPLTEPEIVQSLEGPIPAGIGYYVLTNPNDKADTWPIRGNLLHERYEAAPVSWWRKVIGGING